MELAFWKTILSSYLVFKACIYDCSWIYLEIQYYLVYELHCELVHL